MNQQEPVQELRQRGNGAAIAGLVLILILIVIGILLFRNDTGDVVITENETSVESEPLSDETDLESIEADLEATSFTELDADMQEFDSN